jgi:hypothetical protein
VVGFWVRSVLRLVLVMFAILTDGNARHLRSVSKKAHFKQKHVVPDEYMKS